MICQVKKVTDGLVKKIKYKCMLNKMSQYFPKSYDISNYSTKADLKGATVADTSNLAAKSYLASLKHEVDRIQKN